ncbi:MAG: GYD domain-containing protein [candidate division NC10 bacterium]|nr:GYD domain-containing protein [candidate division NC10 bacterium]
MPAYITLVNFTDQGVRNVKDTTKRAKAFQAGAEKAGVKVKAEFWTMGRYDIVIITEAPDDETISRAMLRLGSLGNVRTETLRAFSAKEMDKLLKGLP